MNLIPAEYYTNFYYQFLLLMMLLVLVQGGIKLAAGWLIEQCGWKGKVVGNTGTWKNQALVLVNHGSATGKEVFEFSEQIIQSVKKTYNVVLEREVNIF